MEVKRRPVLWILVESLATNTNGIGARIPCLEAGKPISGKLARPRRASSHAKRIIPLYLFLGLAPAIGIEL